VHLRKSASIGSQVGFDRVKTEGRLWVLAGAKNMGYLMPESDAVISQDLLFSRKTSRFKKKSMTEP
jgi:hypothetical protein